MARARISYPQPLVFFCLTFLVGSIAAWGDGLCPPKTFDGRFCFHAKQAQSAPINQEFCLNIARYEGESPGVVTKRISEAFVEQIGVEHRSAPISLRSSLLDAINGGQIGVQTLENSNSRGQAWSKPFFLKRSDGGCAPGGDYCLCLSQMAIAMTEQIFRGSTSDVDVSALRFEDTGGPELYRARAWQHDFSCSIPSKPGPNNAGYICPDDKLVRKQDRMNKAQVYFSRKMLEKMSTAKKQKKLRGCLFIARNKKNSSVWHDVHGGIIRDVDKHGTFETFEGNNVVPLGKNRFGMGIGYTTQSLDSISAVVCPYDYAANQAFKEPLDEPAIAHACSGNPQSILTPNAPPCPQ